MQKNIVNHIGIRSASGLSIGDNDTITTIIKQPGSQIIFLPSADDILVGSSTTDIFSNKTIIGGNSNNHVVANYLKSLSGSIQMDLSNPVSGQVLTATSNSGAVWQNTPNPYSSTILFAINPNNIALNTSADLIGWTENTDISNLFNTTTGIYTVPSSGLYEVTAIINYNTLAAITVQLGSNIPQFQIVDVSNNTILLLASMPVLNVNIVLLLSINTILGAGTVPISGIIRLSQGQTIKLRYNANGFSSAANITFKTTSQTSLSIKKISE